MKALSTRAKSAGNGDASVPLRRDWNRRLDQTTELAGKIDRHAGVHGALAIKKALRALEGEDPLVPDVGVNVEALPAVEPEADEPLRRNIVARQRQRHEEWLALL